MTRLKTRRGAAFENARTPAPSRLSRVFDQPILGWQRLETEPLDAAYYVLLRGAQEQVLWINQRAATEPKVARAVAAMQLLPGFTTPLVCADTTLTRLEYPYLITEYWPIPTVAESWRFLDHAGRQRAARAWGAGVKLLHHTRFDLAGDLAYPEAQGARLPEELEARWQKPLQQAQKDYMLDIPRLASALKHGQALAADAPITLCHGFPNGRSFLFDAARGDVRAIVNLTSATRSDPLTDLAAIMHELRSLGCEEAFFQGYGALSKWERQRLEFYELYHELQDYALALSHFPNRLALSRLRLADLLEAAPTY
jgi:hypothetical protein